MTDDLYERYKEALRVGHVAVLRGALEEAIEAYRTAATIAPSRALPHTSLGGVLLRLGHLDEALVEYAAAVARAPHDEGALLGQAEALAMGGQRVDAAMVLDHVSEIQEAAARLPEAADTLRRAMELEESVERSRRQRGLLRQIRLSAGDHAAEQLLAKALRLRDEPAEVAAPTSRVETPPAAVWPSADLAAMPDVAEIAAPQEALISIGVMDGAIDSQSIGVGESQHQPTGDELLAAAEAADLSGDVTTLRSLLLWTARAYAREGRFEAGLDATHRLLQRVPSDVDAHLVLVELYVARDWQSLAADKLALLGRLAELNDDTETHERLGVVARRSFPKDERLCAMFG
jgi:tetratricopeptide (TPR) repeat protein